MLLVKGVRKERANDSHFLLRAILDYPHENAFDFEGTCELVAREYQVAIELHRNWLAHIQVLCIMINRCAAQPYTLHNRCTCTTPTLNQTNLAM